MKSIIALIALSVAFSNNVYADKNMGAIAAGVAIAFIAASASADKCIKEDYTNYIKNKNMVASPGDAMIDKKKNICIKPELILTREINPVKKYKISIMEGDSFSKVSPDKDLKIKIAADAFGDPVHIYVNNEGYITKTGNNFKQLLGERIFTYRDRVAVYDSTFSQEIIYTGLSDSSINFLYREYIGNMIRSPFTIPLTFNIHNSNKINIKGISLEIIKADNELIEYIVN